jgi:hypothetical protein
VASQPHKPGPLTPNPTPNPNPNPNPNPDPNPNPNPNQVASQPYDLLLQSDARNADSLQEHSPCLLLRLGLGLGLGLGIAP